MTLRVAVVGAGYWGPNLVRNFRNSPTGTLVAVCDLDEARAARVVGDRHGRRRRDVAGPAAGARRPRRGRHRHAGATRTDRSRWRPSRPASTCWSRSRSPTTRADGRGDGRRRPTSAGWSSCATTPTATRRPSSASREMIADGELGDILFIDSVRINLGLVQPDVDVLWDLAPHDLSILDSDPARRACARGRSAPTAPTRSAPARPASATSPCRSPAARSPTSTSTGSARPRSARWSSAAAAGRSSGTTSTPSSG